MSSEPGIVARTFGFLWRGITRARVILSNLLFLLVVLFLISLFTARAPAPIPDRAALVINPVGTVVDQRSWTDPLALLFSEPLPEEREVLLDDIVDSILYARDDPRITALVMELDQLYAVGISKTGEIAEALAEFRESGKPIIAWGDGFTQNQYLLAAQADTLIIHPMGDVILEGFSNYQWYFAEALEKLSVSVHVFRSGEHKSIAEPLLRNDMSPGEKEISQRWLGQLWSSYTEQVEQRRQLAPGAVNNYIDSFAKQAGLLGGDLADLALQSGLVDRVAQRREANDWLVELVGDSDEYGGYVGVGFEQYVRQMQPSLESSIGKPQVAIVTGAGMILDGDQPEGSIGGESLANLIYDAVDDDEIAAIVLRLDTGGGSAFASELIRQKLLYARERGKPVVVSMGSVTASGGYWIAAAADEVWATPTTVTGSIGVFGAIPTIDRLLDRLGVHTDGIGTTPISGALRSDRPLQPAVADTYQAAIDGIYERFVHLVAEGRDMPVDTVRELATGNVWSGQHALELGLVDQLGGLRDAIDAAAKLAELDDFVAVNYSMLPSPREELLRALLEPGALSFLAVQSPLQRGLANWTAPLRDSIEILSALKPRGVYAHCLVCLAP